jgi:hypothetical protein
VSDQVPSAFRIAGYDSGNVLFLDDSRADVEAALVPST